MKLSHDQEKALRAILRWYRKVESQSDGQESEKSDSHGNKYHQVVSQQVKQESIADRTKVLSKLQITLGGYAGTGKTTMVAILRRLLRKYNKRIKVAFCSYTGRAVQVLASQLKEHNVQYPTDSISTIHGLIYSPIEDEDERIIGWQRKSEIDCDLIIVDEASMINEKIWRDLCSYDIPIIAIGDHGQLPPIEGKFNLMKEPDLILEEIHRQAKNNPIIQLSIMARENGFIPVGSYGTNVKKFDRRLSETRDDVEDLLRDCGSDTLVLCGYNRTRVQLNEQIREMTGFYSSIPEIGDRTICLRNNHEQQIYNGMLGKIVSITDEDENWYFAEINLDDKIEPYRGFILKEQFGAKNAMNFTQNRKKTIGADLFDFGYAITVHKAQGSQAHRVILFEERFRSMDDLDWKRWLYTAVTRAESELYIIGDER